jgi:endonuclease/exonuclease/phosphatase family metal-dependent hydrolase
VQLRVVTYNVRALRDDARAVARVLRALEPDVVCIQEAPRFFRWRSRCAALARESGLFFAGGGRPTGGTAVLTHLRVNVRSVDEHKLSKHRGLHQRGLVTVQVSRGGRGGTEVAVASTHLGLAGSERVTHAGEVISRLMTSPSTARSPFVVLAGDFNETSGEPAVARLLAAGFVDAWAAAPYGGELTFSARRPRRRIDYVLVSSGVEILRCGVPEGLPDVRMASDHLPVLADLRLPEP